MPSRNVKKRNWAFIVYPDSAPADWQEILRQTGLQCVVSPLHDSDLDPTGEPKTPLSCNCMLQRPNFLQRCKRPYG